MSKAPSLVLSPPHMPEAYGKRTEGEGQNHSNSNTTAALFLRYETPATIPGSSGCLYRSEPEKAKNYWRKRVQCSTLLHFAMA
ncbi:hypothetical protein A7K99_03970 [Tatumella citrea]|uniref:Uncharacterized protein n=1 Tax=Tatumella citrea TaxID=53336 RepID=A0A1Y0L5T9_TATCI|nr:hypothetical protein A7K98_03970 [Tatumella citrea]ARU97066.1 hypothetical protein A7K99_03970 [Tatumella citrea]